MSMITEYLLLCLLLVLVAVCFYQYAQAYIFSKFQLVSRLLASKVFGSFLFLTGHQMQAHNNVYKKSNKEFYDQSYVRLKLKKDMPNFDHFRIEDP